MDAMAEEEQEPQPTVPPFEITEEKVILGRKRECDVVVPDGKCSKYHARIFREEKAFRLVDLGSQNGTFVNEDKVTSRLLQDGDRLRLGFTVFTFSVEEGADPPRARIVFLKQVEPPPDVERDLEIGDKGEGQGGKEEHVGALAPAPVTREEGPPVPGEADPDDDTKVLGKSPLASPPHESEYAPFSGEGKKPTEVFVVPFVPLFICAALVIALFFFLPEIRSYVGLDPEEDPSSSATALSPELQEAATLQESLDALLVRLEALEKGLMTLPPPQEAGPEAEKFEALRRDLEGAFHDLREGGAALHEDVVRLRAELSKRLKALEKALSEGPVAPPREPEVEEKPAVGPEEALYREVMDALEKGE